MSSKNKTSPTSWGCLVLIVLLFLTGILKVPRSCRSPQVTQYDFSHRTVTEADGATSRIFEGKHKPPLILDGGSAFVNSVNRALEATNLPKVSGAVPEWSSITGSRYHRTIYRWTDYPRGELRVERSSCSDARFEGYDCIWKIRLYDSAELGTHRTDVEGLAQ